MEREHTYIALRRNFSEVIVNNVLGSHADFKARLSVSSEPVTVGYLAILIYK